MSRMSVGWRGVSVVVSVALAVALGGCGSAKTSTDTKRTAAPASDAHTPPGMDPGSTGHSSAPADAPIVVDSPQQFDVVSGTLKLAGTTRHASGTLLWTLSAAPGQKGVSGTVKLACSGRGCRSTFHRSIPLKGVRPASYTLTITARGPAGTDETVVPVTVH